MIVYMVNPKVFPNSSFWGMLKEEAHMFIDGKNVCCHLVFNHLP